MKLSEKLRLLREETGKTQEQVCNELGIGIQTLRNYENDNKDKIPSTVQLKMLKDFYNVTYEYLLDENCENRTNESVDIGKKLRLSDQAIKNIVNLQYKNGRLPREFITALVPDTESPIIFSNWLESIDIAEYVVLIEEYKILNNILETLKYFSNIDMLNSYILNCINKKDSLDNLFKILYDKLSDLKTYISKSIFSDLKEPVIENLNVEIQRLNDFCSDTRKKSITIKDVSNITVFIEGIGSECSERTQRTIKYCLFEITDLLKKDLESNYSKADELSTPSEYKNTLKRK